MSDSTPLLPQHMAAAAGQHSKTTSLVDFPFVEPSSWSTVDDRVRGGSSQSYLEPLTGGEGKGVALAKEHGVRFFGNLDITTLGGAGFASQSYTFPADAPLAIPSSSFSGVALHFLPSSSPAPSDAHSEKHAHKPRTLTLVLKTSAPPAKRPDGRLEATLSYEAHVVAPLAGGTVAVRWSEFEATYRGKPQKDAPPFETDKIRAIGLMCRSDFGAQAGPFEFLLAGVDGLARSRSWAERLRALFARMLSWISC